MMFDLALRAADLRLHHGQHFAERPACGGGQARYLTLLLQPDTAMRNGRVKIIIDPTGVKVRRSAKQQSPILRALCNCVVRSRRLARAFDKEVMCIKKRAPDNVT